MKKLVKEKPLNQSQIIVRLANEANYHKHDIKNFFDSLTNILIDEAKRGVVLPGIGRVILVDRKARMARNPMTGEAVKVPAKKALKFRFAKSFKEAITPKKANLEVKKLVSKKKKK